MSIWIIVVGMIFVIEGVIWMVAPNWFVKILSEASPTELRVYGGIVAALGVAFLWAMQ